MRPSERYQRDLERVVAFRDAYARVLTSGEWAPGQFFLAEYRPKAGHDQEFSQAVAAAARAAGAAGVVFGRYGDAISIRIPGYAASSLNPVANWQLTLKESSGLEIRDLLALLEACIGRLEHYRNDAIERERGLIGAIARFVRIPMELREAVGVEAGSTLRAAAFGTGVLAQILVAALGGALATGIVAGSIWLIQR